MGFTFINNNVGSTPYDPNLNILKPDHLHLNRKGKDILGNRLENCIRCKVPNKPTSNQQRLNQAHSYPTGYPNQLQRKQQPRLAYQPPRGQQGSKKRYPPSHPTGYRRKQRPRGTHQSNMPEGLINYQTNQVTYRVTSNLW